MSCRFTLKQDDSGTSPPPSLREPAAVPMHGGEAKLAFAKGLLCAGAFSGIT